jgi:hypothetical protein
VPPALPARRAVVTIEIRLPWLAARPHFSNVPLHPPQKGP